MMTKDEMMQDLFNKMWRGLAGQDWQPAYSDSTDSCSYRMPDGRKCAVGHCIPDDMYSADIEGLSVDVIGIADELGWNKWREVMEFLEEAQITHDSKPDDLKAQFEGIADDYGLTIPDQEPSK